MSTTARALASLTAITLLLLTLGCAHGLAPLLPGPVPEAPGQAVVVPAAPAPPPKAPPELPPNWQELITKLTLADVVDIALANSPSTRASWLNARAAAAHLGSVRSDYYPSVDLTADFARTKTSALSGQYSFLNNTYGPSLALSYLLLDFGGRGARVEEAKSNLLAADWDHNTAVQEVVLQVEVAYYRFLESRASLKAAEANVKEATTNLEAARKRREVGVATVADVLQAQTALSQAELDRVQQAGTIEVLRGSLADAMGLPANTPLEVGELPMESVQHEKLTESVEQLIDRAMGGRPELASSRFRAVAARRHADSIRAQKWPELDVSANAGRTYYDPSSYGKYADTWSAAIFMKVPLFTGFQQVFDLEESLAQAEASATAADQLEQQVVLDVWTAYVGLQTAAARVTTATDLVASATESERVALGRYKEGVGSILDLLAAQSTLASARSQLISAQADWFVAAAQLARSTGTLGSGPATTITSSEATEQKP